MKQISIDALNAQLFATIEMLKSNNDPNASANEKIDIETAKTIAELAKVAVEGFKTKAQVLSLLSKSENPQELVKQSVNAGMLPENTAQ